jgi:hypothetical protein
LKTIKLNKNQWNEIKKYLDEIISAQMLIDHGSGKLKQSNEQLDATIRGLFPKNKYDHWKVNGSKKAIEFRKNYKLLAEKSIEEKRIIK